MNIFKIIVVYLLILSIGLFCCGCGKEKKKTVHQINKMIEELTSDSEYLDADFDKRKEMANELLEGLKKDGNIKHYSYDERSKMFSFTFSNDTLGGIYLSDFAHHGDSLHMN